MLVASAWYPRLRSNLYGVRLPPIIMPVIVQKVSDIEVISDIEDVYF